MHIAAESWVGTRSWQAGDSHKSLIYWVHFLLTQATSSSPRYTLPTHIKQGQRGKQKVESEGRERLTERRVAENEW